MNKLQMLFSSPNEVVAAIHEEFDTAQDRILAEAKAIIASHKVSDRAERLERLGFTATPEVKNKHSLPLVESKEQAELIEYYKINYPFQKFITEKEMERICDKYNLVFAPVSAYKEKVPEKNLREIENAPALRPSLITDKKVCYQVSCNIAGLTPQELKKARKGVFIELKDYENASNSKVLTMYFKKEVKCEYETIFYSAKIIDNNGLFIAAPKSHFDLSKLKQQGKHGFFNITVVEVKDPIVFRYCKGGLQILSKWGLEGEDEALVNEIMN